MRFEVSLVLTVYFYFPFIYFEQISEPGWGAWSVCSNQCGNGNRSRSWICDYSNSDCSMMTDTIGECVTMMGETVAVTL
jgi:hypothetical protein